MSSIGAMAMPVDFRYREVFLKGRPRHDRYDPFRIRHPSMDRGHRAKIFAPFDALKGFGGSIATTDGKTGANYEALKTINREFVAIAKELKPLKFIGAYLQGVVGPGTTPWCEPALLTITPETPKGSLGPDGLYADTTLVTRFDASDGRTRLMVVNMDYAKARTIHVKAPAPLERFNALKGAWSPVGSDETDLALPKGGGFLLRLAK